MIKWTGKCDHPSHMLEYDDKRQVSCRMCGKLVAGPLRDYISPDQLEILRDAKKVWKEMGHQLSIQGAIPCAETRALLRLGLVQEAAPTKNRKMFVLITANGLNFLQDIKNAPKPPDPLDSIVPEGSPVPSDDTLDKIRDLAMGLKDPIPSPAMPRETTKELTEDLLHRLLKERGIALTIQDTGVVLLVGDREFKITDFKPKGHQDWVLQSGKPEVWEAVGAAEVPYRRQS